MKRRVNKVTTILVPMPYDVLDELTKYIMQQACSARSDSNIEKVINRKCINSSKAIIEKAN